MFCLCLSLTDLHQKSLSYYSIQYYSPKYLFSASLCMIYCFFEPRTLSVVAKSNEVSFQLKIKFLLSDNS